MAKCPIFNLEGKETENFELPDEIFGVKVNQDVIHQAVVMYQASLRQGNASTKTRSDVSGGGKKPWRQKGTGRARHSSTRSPLWHKGGVVFGPHPRDFGYTLPTKIRKAALRESLNAKFQKNDFVCLDDVKKSLSKTKEFATALKKLKLKDEGKVLAILDGSHESVNRVTRNLAFFNQMRSQDVNAYDVLRNKKVLVTKTALKQLLERIK